MKAFDDKTVKLICAEYVQLRSYSAVAKKLGVSASGVKKIILKHPDCVRMCDEKNEENSKEILAYMEDKKDIVCDIIDRYLSALLDEERIERATTVQLTTSLGTLIDKFAMIKKENETDKEGGVVFMPEVIKDE